MVFDSTAQQDATLKIESKEQNCEVLKEVSILSQIVHPNIVQMIEHIETESANIIVTEYLPGGDLSFLIKRKLRIEEDFARIIFVQIANAVNYCHSQKVTHNNICPGNIVLGKSCAKLVDFCRASVQQRVIPTLANFEENRPPESFSDTYYDPQPADVWQLGILLYTMLAGVNPFFAAKEKQFIANIRKGKYEPIAGITEEACDVIRLMLNPDPDRRASITSVVQCKWLQMKVGEAPRRRGRQE